MNLFVLFNRSLVCWIRLFDHPLIRSLYLFLSASMELLRELLALAFFLKSIGLSLLRVFFLADEERSIFSDPVPGIKDCELADLLAVFFCFICFIYLFVTIPFLVSI